MDPTDELNEADIFFSDNNFLPTNRHNNSLFPTQTATNSRLFPRQLHNHHNRNGIRAALPGSASSMILFSSGPSSPPPSKPIIPKPKEREFSSPRGMFQQQSAPVKVPVFQSAMENRRKGGSRLFEVEYDDEDDEYDEMLPPHEIVARGSSVSSPMTPFSVLEGKGRTLKGRDLRQVRNAIWRQTGFLD